MDPVTDDPVTDTDSASRRWRRRDAWLGLLFLTVGGLMSWYAVLAYGNKVPLALWGAAAGFGPFMVLLGSNAIVRSLLARR